MNRELFTEGIKALGGMISNQQTEQFAAYSQMLKEWNEKINLTAIVDDDGIAQKHFLDSILPLYYTEIPKGAKVADVGTGAGFPGLPVKIMRPDLSVTLMDALNKRINFLQAVVDCAGIKDAFCVHGRAEELGKNKEYREKYDAVVSRAVANMRVLSEYCLPFVKVGGKFLALKADDIDEELNDARPMIGSLGGKVEAVLEMPLPGTEILRKLVVIKKEKPTPPQFPRRPNKIKKG